MASKPRKLNRYSQLLETVFFRNYVDGARTVDFERQEFEHAAEELGIILPKNLGDVIYSFRFRSAFPDSIQAKAPAGEAWNIRGTGRSKYQFYAEKEQFLEIDPLLTKVKIPDSTPGLIARYALSDEQALLAKLRYNRMLDIFTGITCYSLQNHLRTSVSSIGQTETDEVYVGVDQAGVQYVLPVQAKGGRDKLGLIQIQNDAAMCGEKFPDLVCKPIAAQFIDDTTIALMAFVIESDGSVGKLIERHYRLLPFSEIDHADLEAYRRQLQTG